MSPDGLEQKTDAELNEIFVAEVCDVKFFDDGVNHHLTTWPFCSDANAVLPWLEKQRWHTAPRYPAEPYSVAVRLPPGVLVGGVDWDAGQAPTFARAAVIALIRAKRATP